MQKLHLINYATPHYVKQQLDLCRIAVESSQFDSVEPYTKARLMGNERWYKKNKSILDEKRGAGFWFWKPTIILDKLLSVHENDIVLYMDCGDIFAEHEINSLRAFLFERMSAANILLTDGAFPNKDWTKRDCFVLLGCDTPEYHNAIQVEAGIIVVKNTIFSRCFIEAWMLQCGDRRVLTDDENTCGLPNLEGFKDHRHDQSVLSLLSQRHKTETADGLLIQRSNEMRRFIYCNKNDNK